MGKTKWIYPQCKSNINLCWLIYLFQPTIAMTVCAMLGRNPALVLTSHSAGQCLWRIPANAARPAWEVWTSDPSPSLTRFSLVEMDVPWSTHASWLVQPSVPRRSTVNRMNPWLLVSHFFFFLTSTEEEFPVGLHNLKNTDRICFLDLNCGHKTDIWHAYLIT